MTKYVVLFLIFGTFLHAQANGIYKYVGNWKSSDNSVDMILKNNGQCILKKKSKIIAKNTECIWSKQEGSVMYNKKEMFYFKLDNNELIIAQDKRSLTREKADLIMHKIQ